MWIPGRRLRGGARWVAMSHASFCPLHEAGSLGPEAPATAALLTPTKSEPHQTHQPCRHGYPGAICSASTRRPTSQGSNGFDTTTPCRRKGCFQHPKAAQGIPVSLTPILAIKESFGHSETSKLPRPWSKVELSNRLRALWAQGAWGALLVALKGGPHSPRPQAGRQRGLGLCSLWGTSGLEATGAAAEGRVRDAGHCRTPLLKSSHNCRSPPFAG